LHNAAIAEEGYFAAHEHYVDCIGAAACRSTLGSSFTGSPGVDIAMFQIPQVGLVPEYFTGRSFHPQGSRNNLATAFLWIKELLDYDSYSLANLAKRLNVEPQEIKPFTQELLRASQIQFENDVFSSKTPIAEALLFPKVALDTALKAHVNTLLKIHILNLFAWEMLNKKAEPLTAMEIYKKLDDAKVRVPPDDWVPFRSDDIFISLLTLQKAEILEQVNSCKSGTKNTVKFQLRSGFTTAIMEIPAAAQTAEGLFAFLSRFQKTVK